MEVQTYFSVAQNKDDAWPSGVLLVSDHLLWPPWQMPTLWIYFSNQNGENSQAKFKHYKAYSHPRTWYCIRT